MSDGARKPLPCTSGRAMILRAEIGASGGLGTADDAQQRDAIAQNGAFCLTNAQLQTMEAWWKPQLA